MNLKPISYLLTSTTILIILVGCSSETSVVENNFIDACTASGVAKEACKCTFDEIGKDKVVAFDNLMNDGISDEDEQELREIVQNAKSKCQKSK